MNRIKQSLSELFDIASSFGARFWFFWLGVACAGYGADGICPRAGWLLAGLIIVWDATRKASK